MSGAEGSQYHCCPETPVFVTDIFPQGICQRKMTDQKWHSTISAMFWSPFRLALIQSAARLKGSVASRQGYISLVTALLTAVSVSKCSILSNSKCYRSHTCTLNSQNSSLGQFLWNLSLAPLCFLSWVKHGFKCMYVYLYLYHVHRAWEYKGDSKMGRKGLKL